MKEPVVFFSAFDGMSALQEALRQLLPPDQPYVYLSSEIDEDAIKITMKNFPNTIQLGDIRNITREMIPYNHIHIMGGGSPCQDFSFAGSRKGMTTEEKVIIKTLDQYLKLKEDGFQFSGSSYLYWEYVRLMVMINPDYFLLENVGMAKKWIQVITDGFWVSPIRMNSSLVSAQNRDRIYWTNIPGVTPPEDRNILISDIAHGAVGGCGIRNIYGGNHKPDGTKKYDKPNFTVRKDHKSNTLTCGGNLHKIKLDNGDIRFLTIEESERLQTFPIGYTNVPGLSISARRCVIGNSWTVDMIVHILRHLPVFKNII